MWLNYIEQTDGNLRLGNEKKIFYYLFGLMDWQQIVTLENTVSISIY